MTYFKIWQQYTSGWEVIHRRLTKEECDALLNKLVLDGENPNYIRATIDDEEE